MLCEKNQKMKNKILLSDMLFISIGAVFLLLENTFYQYVDENGLLHESLFLPLGMFSLIFGFILLLIYMAKILMRLFSKSHDRN